MRTGERSGGDVGFHGAKVLLAHSVPLIYTSYYLCVILIDGVHREIKTFCCSDGIYGHLKAFKIHKQQKMSHKY